MRIYKSTLSLHSLSASLWHADTVFGHLCWFLVRKYNEGRLQEFLKLYMLRHGDGDPPVLLSDGFPGDYLPRPVVPRTEAPLNLSKQKRIDFLRQAKKMRSVNWLTLDEFNRMRRGEALNISNDGERFERPVDSRFTTKNWVNRATDTAGDPFDIEEHILPQVTIYWRIEAQHLPVVNEFLKDLTHTGYGKRKSIGYGQIKDITPLEEFTKFENIENANGFVTLSRFVPAPDDPTDGYWNAVVKYGKLGEEFATGPNPFKRPLVQLECGSCFRDSAPRAWYGQLISGLSYRNEVKHYGFAFPLPARLPLMI